MDKQSLIVTIKETSRAKVLNKFDNLKKFLKENKVDAEFEHVIAK